MNKKPSVFSLLLLEGLALIVFIIVEVISDWLNFDIGIAAVAIFLPCAVLILLYYLFIKKNRSREQNAKKIKDSLDKLQHKKNSC